MTDQSLDHRWANVPVAKRIFLIAAILFGAIGVLDTVLFVSAIDGPLASTHQWASAFGLGVAVNSLYWLFAWQKGTFTKVNRVLLAFALLLFTCFAVYIGLQALSASMQEVGLLDA
jgi:hypothetical protein